MFLDIEIPYYNIDVMQLESAITPKTKMIMVAHTLGNPFNLNAVMYIARKYNLWVVEDDCDSLGAEYNRKKPALLAILLLCPLSRPSYYNGRRRGTAD